MPCTWKKAHVRPCPCSVPKLWLLFVPGGRLSKTRSVASVLHDPHKVNPSEPPEIGNVRILAAPRWDRHVRQVLRRDSQASHIDFAGARWRPGACLASLVA
jgi:hypothetical protein